MVIICPGVWEGWGIRDPPRSLYIKEVPRYADKGYGEEAKKKGWLRFWK